MPTTLENAAKKARDWTEQRNRLILDQFEIGASLRTIAKKAGLSHSAIVKIRDKSS